MTELGQTIATTMDDLERTKRGIDSEIGSIYRYNMFTDTYTTDDTYLKIQKRQIGSALIFSHPKNGKVGSPFSPQPFFGTGIYSYDKLTLPDLTKNAAGGLKWGISVVCNRTNVTLCTVEQHSSQTATWAWIHDYTTHDCLGSARFIGTVATFNYPLTNGVTYIVVVNNLESAYQMYYNDTLGNINTYTGVNISATHGVQSGGGTNFGNWDTVDWAISGIKTKTTSSTWVGDWNTIVEYSGLTAP